MTLKNCYCNGLMKFPQYFFSQKQKNFKQLKKTNLLKEKVLFKDLNNPALKKEDNLSSSIFPKGKYSGQKLNLNFENLKNIIVNLSKNNNHNYNVPNNDISHEEFFEVKQVEKIQVINKPIKFDTTEIYNETILTYILDNLENLKDKEKLNLENITALIEIITQKNIGNLEIFEKFIYIAEEILKQETIIFTNKCVNNDPNTKNDKENYLNDLLAFFKIYTEMGKTKLDILNIFLEKYISNINFNQITSNHTSEKDSNYISKMSNLYNLLWLISISISNICENSKGLSSFNNSNNSSVITHSTNKNSNSQSNINIGSKSLFLEIYDKNLEKELLLSEKAVVNLVNLMKYISKSLDLENSISLDIDQKVRLYKSLVYLKLEGITLNENLENFVKKFKSFHMMNLLNKTTGSLMEKKFSEILNKFNIQYEKEKKTDFCSGDFFIKPNIIIEINGPDHYCFGILKGKDNIKKRSLKFLGYKVLNISYKEFNNLTELENKIKHILKVDLKKIFLNNK